MTQLTEPPVAGREMDPRPRLHDGRRLGAAHTGKAAVIFTAAVLAAAVWQILAVTSGGWVPSLIDVADRTVVTVQSGEFYDSARVTLIRILVIMTCSMVIGTLMGLAAGLSTHIESFLRPLLVIGLAIPDPVYIIMAVLILGVGESSGLIAVILAIAPLVANVVLGAVLSRDKGLDEMAFTYRYSWARYVRHVLAGQIMPAVAVANRTAFAFSWKLVVLMEALVASDGVGNEIYHFFKLLRPADMVAYTLVFIVIMRCIEGLVFRPFERRAARWRM